MERTKSTPPLVFREPIIFSLENHLVNVLSISLLFSLLLSLDFFLSFDLHPLVFDIIECLYYSVWGVLCLFLLPYLKKIYTLMVQIRDTNPKMLPTTFCERAIFINDMFLYICVLLPLLVVFDHWSCEWDLPDSHLIVLYIMLHLVFSLIAYFLGEILQTIWNMDGTRGDPFHLILLVSMVCSDDFDHPVFFVLFMGLFIIFHRILTPKTLAIYPKIKGIISDLLKSVRGENREEKPLADSDSTNNRTYQSGLLLSNSGKISAREASKGARMAEGVLSSVDSTTRISSNSDAKRVCESFFIDLLSIFLLFSPILPLSYFLSLDLPPLVSVVLLFSQRLVFLLSFFVSCTVFRKWYTIMVLTLKMVAIYQKNKGTISDLFKFMRGKNREEKPLVDFYCTKNNRACQSRLQSSNSEKANAREAKQGLVDSTARITSRDFDAPDYRAHLGGANKGCPIMLNSEKKDTREGLNGESLIMSVLSLDDSTKQKSFPDFGATENKAHLVRAYQSGPVVSLSENKNREEALKRECITKSILGLEDLQQHCCGRCDAAAKSSCAICDPGLHTTDSLTRKSFEVLENLMPWEQLRNAIDIDQARQIQTQICRELFDARGGHLIHVDTYFGCLRTHLCPNLCDSVCIHSIFGEKTIDFVPLLSLRRSTLKGCIRQEKSPYLPWKTLALKCWVRLKKSQDLPRTLQMKSSGGLTTQSASSLHWPIGLTDGGHIVSVPEKKVVTIKTFKRKCRTMSASFEDHNRHCSSRCKGAANSLGAKCRGSIWYTVKRIYWQHVIQWCPFRRGYSLGGETPAEVISLSMEEELVSRLKFLSVYGVRRLRHLALLSGSESVGYIFSSSEFAATNNRAGGRQDRCGSSASRHEKERTMETPNWEGIASHVITFEHLRQRFGSKREDVAKSLGISVSTLKRVCRHHGIHRWPNRIRNRVLRPPDPHWEKNPSPTFKTLSIIEQITVDKEMGCQNPKPNEFQPDSFEDLNFQNTENGSISEMLSDWDFLALEEEPSLEGHVSGSVNLTVAACSDPAPCQHPMPTIPDTMTTTHMMPHLSAKDMRFVTLKVTYGKKIIKFQFPLMSGIIELKEEVKKRLKLELDSFDIEYKDEDGDCIFLGCDEDLRNHLQLFSNQVIRLLVVDSDANTANFR